MRFIILIERPYSTQARLRPPVRNTPNRSITKPRDYRHSGLVVTSRDNVEFSDRNYRDHLKFEEDVANSTSLR